MADEISRGSPFGSPQGQETSPLDDMIASVQRGAAVLEAELRDLRQQLRDKDQQERHRSDEQARVIAELRAAEARARDMRTTVDREASALIADFETRLQSLREAADRLRAAARDYHEQVLESLSRWRSMEAGVARPSAPPPAPAPDSSQGHPFVDQAQGRKVVRLQAAPVPNKEGVAALVRRLAQLPGVAGIRLATVEQDSVTFLVNLDVQHLDVSSLLDDGAAIAEADSEHIVLRLPT